MSTDRKKWNPFKFLRGAARKSDADENQETPSADEQWRAFWPDMPRLFSREPWRAVEGFFHDPFAGRGALERWFGDFSSSRFQPRIDVVDEGPVLRVTAELPGMEREDVNVSVEDGAIVLRGEKKQVDRYRLEQLTAQFIQCDQGQGSPASKFVRQAITASCADRQSMRGSILQLDIQSRISDV